LRRRSATPVDREDLFRLSRSIDDVLDNLRDFSRELELYRPPDVRSFLPLLHVIGGALDALHDSVRSLADGPDAIVDAARRSDHAASAVRREFELAIARALDRASDEGALRERELLRRLDVVGLRLGEAADALGDGGLKRVS